MADAPLKSQATPDPAPQPEADAAMMANMIAAQAQFIADLQAQIAKLAPPAPGPVGKKLYFNSIPFCSVQIMRSPGHCEAVNFVAGQLETDDPVVQAALDLICNRPGGTVTSDNSDPLAAENAAMRADLANLAAIAHKKVVDAGLSTA